MTRVSTPALRSALLSASEPAERRHDARLRCHEGISGLRPPEQLDTKSEIWAPKDRQNRRTCVVHQSLLNDREYGMINLSKLDYVNDTWNGIAVIAPAWPPFDQAINVPCKFFHLFHDNFRMRYEGWRMNDSCLLPISQEAYKICISITRSQCIWYGR